jgi:hypothetical protein
MIGLAKKPSCGLLKMAKTKNHVAEILIKYGLMYWDDESILRIKEKQ